MNARNFAMFLGVVFVFVGIAGFIPGLNHMGATGHDEHLVVTNPGHGMLLGLFHVNVLHNLVHIAFGIWGIGAYLGGLGASRLYAQCVTVIYGLLAVLGLFPRLDTVFGLIPIHGNDAWLHGLIACVSAYFGWAPAATEPTSQMPHSGTPLPR